MCATRVRLMSLSAQDLNATMMMAAVSAAIPESYLAGKFAGNGTNNTKRHILRRRVIFVQGRSC